MLKRFLRIFVLFFSTILLFFMLFLLYDKLYPINLSPLKLCSKVIYAQDKSWLYVTTNEKQKWRFKPTLEEIDPLFIKMLLFYEDKRFYAHFGVDILSMFRAIKQLIVHQRVISGASTITMQLARLLYPEKRTLFAKLKQVLYAFQLEWHLSKEEILVDYLTLTPYGGNVEGIIAGSMRYFGKKPKHLTPTQSALLIALPQSPEIYRPDKNLKRAMEVKQKVLTRVYKKGFMNDFVYTQAFKEKLYEKTFSFPRYAGHLASKILLKKPFESQTTIDFLLQKKLEAWSKKEGKKLAEDTTLALMIIENNSSEIRAYLGSHDRFSKRVEGFIDMIQAIRSPASTLKPFIYGLGFEKYIIHPHTIIRDEEVRFGDYRPHNFSYDYQGEVTIAYALQHSLNIPAVKVLAGLGVHPFITRLKTYTKKIFIPQNSVTLPVALGGLGISLWDLASLYVALANKGEAYPLHYLKSQKEHTRKRLLSPRASMLVTSILKKTPRPKNFLQDDRELAYKTGTSYGYRDAWSVGYNHRYTLLSWVGKPKNTPQLHMTGLNTATPLLFDAFLLLKALSPDEKWESKTATTALEDIPKQLRYFDAKKKHTTKPLRFLSPPPKSRFKSVDCDLSMVDIKIENGTPPYYWYIDGKAKNMRGKKLNKLFDYGGHTVVIIDARGERISRDIWIEPSECEI